MKGTEHGSVRSRRPRNREWSATCLLRKEASLWFRLGPVSVEFRNCDSLTRWVSRTPKPFLRRLQRIGGSLLHVAGCLHAVSRPTAPNWRRAPNMVDDGILVGAHPVQFPELPLPVELVQGFPK